MRCRRVEACSYDGWAGHRSVAKCVGGGVRVVRLSVSVPPLGCADWIKASRVARRGEGATSGRREAGTPGA